MNFFLQVPPPVYALLMLALCKVINSLSPPPFDISAPAIGWALAAAGLGLLFWAWLCFFNKKTTPIPTGEPSALVGEGPYRFTRNPMYLGVLMILVGLVFFLGSPVYILTPAGFFLVVDRLFIPYEETKLERLFGTEYNAWRLVTRRWL